MIVAALCGSIAGYSEKRADQLVFDVYSRQSSLNKGSSKEAMMSDHLATITTLSHPH